jgi:predicted RNA binding protein YcfA (HicA-like mRNA interferase family)
MKQIVSKLEDQGWTVEQTGGEHYRAKGPDGQLVFMPSSPSDFRSERNARAFLRRNGAKL